MLYNTCGLDCTFYLNGQSFIWTSCNLYFRLFNLYLILSWNKCLSILFIAKGNKNQYQCLIQHPCFDNSYKSYDPYFCYVSSLISNIWIRLLQKRKGVAWKCEKILLGFCGGKQLFSTFWATYRLYVIYGTTLIKIATFQCQRQFLLNPPYL